MWHFMVKHSTALGWFSCVKCFSNKIVKTYQNDALCSFFSAFNVTVCVKRVYWIKTDFVSKYCTVWCQTSYKHNFIIGIFQCFAFLLATFALCKKTKLLLILISQSNGCTVCPLWTIKLLLLRQIFHIVLLKSLLTWKAITWPWLMGLHSSTGAITLGRLNQRVRNGTFSIHPLLHQ